jgi:hypothetical protein
MHRKCGGMEAAAGCVTTDTGSDGLICMHTNCGGMEAVAGCVETGACRDGLTDACTQTAMTWRRLHAVSRDGWRCVVSGASV